MVAMPVANPANSRTMAIPIQTPPGSSSNSTSVGSATGAKPAPAFIPTLPRTNAAATRNTETAARILTVVFMRPPVIGLHLTLNSRVALGRSAQSSRAFLHLTRSFDSLFPTGHESPRVYEAIRYTAASPYSIRRQQYCLFKG